MKSVALSSVLVLPVVLGLGALVFYIDGRIGGATTLLAGFSIAAVSFTAIVFRERGTGTEHDASALSVDGGDERQEIAPGGDL